MKRRMRQGVAMLMAVLTVLTVLPVQNLYAAEVDAVLQGESEVTEAVLERDDIAQGVESVESTESEEIVESSGEVIETETKSQDLLNYLVVDYAYIEIGGTQNIVLDIGDGVDAITSATLIYHRESDGQTYEIQAAEINGSGLRFTMDYTSAELAGVYIIDAVTYTKNEEEYTITMEKAGLDVKYGVDAVVETNPDAEVVDEEETSAVEMDVVTFDEDGNQISQNSMEDVLEAQKSVNVYSKGSNGNLVIVLDPGHDATHAGGRGNGVVEEKVNLKIAQYCKEELSKYQGVTVYMTRDAEACPYGGNSVSSGKCNEARVAFAKSVGADIYVALHNNVAVNAPGASGAQVYYPNKNYNPIASEKGEVLAEDILAQLVALGLNDRGTHIVDRDTSDYEADDFYPDGSTADYYGIIRNAKLQGIPAIIVEHAFMTNASDAANYLSNDAQLKKLGVADATGIAQCYGLTQGAVYNGVNYSAVFDFDYYINKYADIKRVYGNNRAGALAHFVNFGMKEGRQGSAEFNVTSYRYRYADLRRAFGNNLKSYYMHYVNYGKREGRTGTGTTTMQNPTKVYNGTDYSAVYDYNYYITKYPEVKKACGGDDDTTILKYFVETGMSLGHQGSESFDVQSYKNQYVDLRRVFGKNLKSYYTHYIKYGQKEGRKGTGCTTVQNATTVYKGVDYKDVYDFNYYTTKYADIKRVFGNDEDAVIAHFVNYGMKEGRQAKETFNVQIYKNNYVDLQRAFGSNLKSYYLHYINNGKREGRNAVTQIYTSIMGKSNTTAEQLVAYYNAKATFPSYYATDADTEVNTIEDFCRIYIEECNAEGVRAEVAFSQAMLETGFLQYKGDVLIEQYNFAGIDASGKHYKPDGSLDYIDRGREYDSVREGIRAHVQRLKAYAVKGTNPNSFKNPCVDPDKFASNWWTSTIVGIAPHVEWLGKQENPSGFGWATAKGYGTLIKNFMAELARK